MDFLHIVNQIGVIFFVLMVGFVITKLGIIDDHTSKHMSSMVVRVTAPLFIISNMAKESSLSNRDIVMLLTISLSIYGFLFLMAMVLPKLLRVKKEDVGIYRFMTVFGNVGYMGLPVASVIFKDEGVVYAAIFILPFYLLIYTFGIMFVKPHDEDNRIDLKQLINPGVIAVTIGLILFWTGLKLPTFIRDSFQMVGGLTTPLSMIVIGVSLASVKISAMLKNVRIYIFTAIKLLGIPLLLMVVLKALGFDGLLLGIPVLITGMPVAANAVILSKEYGGNDLLASEGIFVTTILCLITIPLMISIL